MEILSVKPRNSLLHTVREAIRHPYAWPGGYPVYVYLEDGVLCAKCARENYRLLSRSTRHNDRDGWKVIGVDVYWEGPAQPCAQCSKECESAYGDPDAKESDGHITGDITIT